MFFFKRLDAEERKLLASHLRTREMVRQETIFQKGQVAGAMFFIEVGSVKAVDQDPEDPNNQITVAVSKSGGFFGEEAILGENAIYQTTTIAQDDGILYVLTLEALQSIMSRSITTGTKILLEVSRTYREALGAPECRAKIVTFYSPKNGVGQTTMATNFAVALANGGKRSVLFFEADFQFGNAAVLTGMSMVPNLAGLVALENSFDRKTTAAYIQKSHGVDFLLGPEMPQDGELISREVVQKLIREMGPAYDFIVVDLKTHIDELTILFWDESDVLFLAGTPDLGFLERAFRLQRLFTRLGYNQNRFFGVMGQMTADSGDFLNEYSRILGRPVFSISYSPELARRAELDAIPMIVSQPNGAFGSEVKKLIGKVTGETPPIEREGGIFNRLKAFFGAGA